jgi:hypothetical protein
MRTLGVDCEGVIFRALGKTIPGVLDALRHINQSGCFADIYIVSRVNIIGRIYFPLRLRYLNFFNRTGIPRDHVIFCRYRKDKARICEQLGITDFVDDNPNVLTYMENVDRLYAFTATKGIRRLVKKEFPAKALSISSWKELVPQLIKSA